MNHFQGQRMNEFKERIGFDEAVKQAVGSDMVVYAWPDLLQAPLLKDGNWAVTAEALFAQPGGAEATWHLAAGVHTMQVTIYVSSQGAQPARERFLQFATENMMARVPYERVEQPIGSLVVEDMGPDDTDRIWWYQNLSVRVLGPHEVVTALSTWLQRQAEAHLVNEIRTRLPQFRDVRVSPERILVGQTARIALELPEGVPPDRYQLRVISLNNIVTIDRDEAMEVEIDAIEPGVAKISVQLIDRLTLLTSVRIVEVPVANR